MLGLAAACTDGEGERARPGPEPTERATTTFETLPPVGSFSWPPEPDVVIAQVTTTGPTLPAPLPVLTIYGDGRAISVAEDEWVQGTLNEIELQDFFTEAASVGLLDESLELRGPQPDPVPDIAVTFTLDGLDLLHQLDLSAIEWPADIRTFLTQSSAAIILELNEPFEPSAWVSCAGDPCTVEVDRTATEDRPVLPHEDAEEVALAVVRDGA